MRAVEQPGGRFGGSLTKSITGGAITKQVGNPNQTFTGSHTVQSCQYVITQGTDRIVPGDTDIGNHCDGCDTFIPLPFNFQLYGATYTGVNVGDNGRLDFVNVNEPGGYITACLPAPPNYFTGVPYDNTLFPLWQDMRTDATLDGCANFPGATAASSRRSQGALRTASSTSNGARYCIGMRRRRRILRCVCMRTIQTGGSTWSSAHSLPPSSALSSARGSRASRETATKDSTLRISVFVGLIRLRKMNRAHTR